MPEFEVVTIVESSIRCELECDGYLEIGASCERAEAPSVEEGENVAPEWDDRKDLVWDAANTAPAWNSRDDVTFEQSSEDEPISPSWESRDNVTAQIES